MTTFEDDYIVDRGSKGQTDFDRQLRLGTKSGRMLYATAEQWNNADGTSWTPENDPTNADATPYYGSVFLGIGAWSCQDWITWLDAMIAKYGATQANITWSTAWNNIPFEKATYTCQYDQTWVNQLKTRGQTFNQDSSAVVVTDTEQAVKSTAGAVEGLTSDLNFATKIIPYAIVATFLIIGIIVYRNFGHRGDVANAARAVA